MKPSTSPRFQAASCALSTDRMAETVPLLAGRADDLAATKRQANAAMIMYFGTRIGGLMAFVFVVKRLDRPAFSLFERSKHVICSSILSFNERQRTSNAGHQTGIY